MTFQPFVNVETYRVDIRYPDAESGEVVGWVELAPLTAGDRQHINDEMVLRGSGEGTAALERLGTMQMLAVEKALRAWSFDADITGTTLRQLDPVVFDQISLAVSYGNRQDGAVPLAPTPSAPAPPANESS